MRHRQRSHTAKHEKFTYIKCLSKRTKIQRCNSIMPYHFNQDSSFILFLRALEKLSPYFWKVSFPKRSATVTLHSKVCVPLHMCCSYEAKVFQFLYFYENNGIYRSVNQKHSLPKGERDYQLPLVIKVIREKSMLLY